MDNVLRISAAAKVSYRVKYTRHAGDLIDFEPTLEDFIMASRENPAHMTTIHYNTMSMPWEAGQAFGKIPSIKHLRELMGRGGGHMGLKAAKELIDFCINNQMNLEVTHH